MQVSSRLLLCTARDVGTDAADCWLIQREGGEFKDACKDVVRQRDE